MSMTHTSSKANSIHVLQLNVGKASPSNVHYETIREFVFENNFQLVFFFEPQFLAQKPNYNYRYLPGFRGCHSQYVSAYWDETLPVSSMDLGDLDYSQYFCCISLGSTLFVIVYFANEIEPSRIIESLEHYISTVPSYSDMVFVADTNASHASWDFSRNRRTNLAPLPASVKTRRGDAIAAFLSRHNCTVVNLDLGFGSFVSRADESESFIDITATSNTVQVFNWDMIQELVAVDHRVIHFQVSVDFGQPIQHGYTHWNTYRRTIDQACGQWFRSTDAVDLRLE